MVLEWRWMSVTEESLSAVFHCSAHPTATEKPPNGCALTYKTSVCVSTAALVYLLSGSLIADTLPEKTYCPTQGFIIFFFLETCALL